MRIIDILISPWAIVPEKLFEIQEIYSTHLRGDKTDFDFVKARINEHSGPIDDTAVFAIINDTAIIPIQGIIAKRMNLLTQISGGVSAQLVGRDIKEALANNTIKSILLDIDSPGGTIDGTQELADIIFAGRGQKPIVAYSDGMIASAAYWIGSAADRIYISGDTVTVGSIGVVASHIDYSRYEEKIGIKTTEIYAGKYKRIASQYQPLSEEGRQTIQDQVDFLYTVFVNEVAKQRSVSVGKVLENMADGKIFIGNQAISAGLVDDMATLDRLINIVLPAMQTEMADAQALAKLNKELKMKS